MGLPLYLLELAFLACAVRAGWRPVQQLTNPSKSALLLALIILAFVSAALAPNPPGSLVWTYLTFLQLIFGFAVAWAVAVTGDQTRSRIWPAIAIGCLIYAGIVAVFAVSPHPKGFDWQYFGLAVSNVRQVGFYMAVGALAAIGCSFTPHTTRSSLWIAVASVMMAVSFWTGSRGASVAVAGAIFVGCLAFARLRSLRNLGMSLAPIPIGALLSVPLPRPMIVFGLSRMIGSFQASTPDAISGFRLRIWKDAWNAFIQRPWIGYGEAQFGIVAPQPQAVYLHPHNLILQVLVQWGIIGFVLVMALAIMAGVSVRRAMKATDSDGVLPAFLVCVGLLLFSSYDGAMFHTYPVMMFAFALAFLMGVPPRRPEPSTGKVDSGVGKWMPRVDSNHD